ncbi:MAG: hypothetical protein JWN86_4426 [Planctomycetota bacterium]|nr:hypothetical protein [Planctomycetota bacterium]
MPVTILDKLGVHRVLALVDATPIASEPGARHSLFFNGFLVIVFNGSIVAFYYHAASVAERSAPWAAFKVEALLAYWAGLLM